MVHRTRIMNVKPTLHVSRRQYKDSVMSRATHWFGRTCRNALLVASLCVAVMMAASIAPAAVVIWDVDGASGGSTGGTGTWDLNATPPLFWDNAGTMQAWSNTALDTALFGGTAGTVTLGEPITAGGLTFGVNGYAITGSTLTLDAINSGVAPVIQVGSANFMTSTGVRSSISSVLAGSMGFAKTGDGTLVLSGANTYTGATVIKGGTLSITNPNQLGVATSTVGVFGTAAFGFQGGTLQLQGGSVNGAGMAFTRDLALAGRGNNTVGAALISIGNNTISGGVTFSSSSEARVAAVGGTTTLSGLMNLGTGNVTQQFFGNGSVVVSGRITGGSDGQIHLLKTTSGIASTLVLSNSGNDFVGATRVDSGTVRVASGAQLGIGTSNNVGNITFNSGTVEIRTDAAASFATKNISYSSNNGTVFVDHAFGSSLINQVVTFGNLRQENNRSNVVFTGRNGYGVSIATLSNNMSGNNADGMTWSGNGTMTVNGTGFWGEATTSGAQTLTLTVTGDMVLNASVVGGATGQTHTFSKTGTGLLTYSPSSVTFTNSPTFRVNQGTVNFAGVGSFTGIGTLNIGNATTTAGTLTYTGSGGALAPTTLNLNTTTANVYLNASGTGALTIGGTITAVAGAKTFVLGGTNTADNTISSVIPANATNLQKIGVGTWVLAPTSSNLFTGSTTVSGGTLKLTDSAGVDILPDAGAVVFNVDAFTQAAGGTLNYIGGAQTETVGALTGTAGHGVVTASSGALNFTSLGTRAVGSTINVSNTGTVNITGTTGFMNAGLYFNSGDFAYSGAGTTLRAPVYGTDAGFVDAAAGAATLTAASHNQVTGAITAQTTVTVSSLKINGANNLTLASGQTITIGATAPAGAGILQAGGSSIISGGTALAASAAGNDFAVRVDGGANTLTINTPMTVSTAGLTKSGDGTLILGGANTYSGTVTINEGMLQMASGGLLGATNIGLAVRQGATFDLNGVNVGTAASGTNSVDKLVGAGTITNSGALAALRVGNNNATTSSAYFTGLITGNVRSRTDSIRRPR